MESIDQTQVMVDIVPITNIIDRVVKYSTPRPISIQLMLSYAA